MKTCESYRCWPFVSLLAAKGKGNPPSHAFCNPGLLGPRLCMTLLRGDNREAAQLLRSGAMPDFQNDPDGWTPLIYAIHYDNPEGRQLLFQHGADPGFADYSGRTPLMFAAMNGNMALLSELLARGADPCARDKSDRTACDYAMLYHHRNCSAELLRFTGNAAESPLPEGR